MTQRAPHRLGGLLAAGLLVGCRPIEPKPDSGVLRFTSEDPTITGLSGECDETAGRWTFKVRSDAWMGTARLWMGTTVESLEQHNLDVSQSSASADWDCYDTTISIAADLENPGSGTRFRCTERTELHVLLAIADDQSQRWTDCRHWGPEPSIWDNAEGVPQCSNGLEDVWGPDNWSYTDGDVAACE
jgi:hypothetical protein